MELAWLTFLVASVYTFFLSESGLQIGSGNFTKSAQIRLFVLFVVSLLFFIRNNKWLITPKQSISNKVGWLFCVLTLGLHVLSGILWYQVNTDSIRTYAVERRTIRIQG